QRGIEDLQVVAINDLTDTRMLAHLLKYDSVHRTFGANIEVGDGFLSVDGNKIKTYAEKDPAKLPWKNDGVEVVLECTGFFTKREDAAKHLSAGARKVIISAPAKGDDLTVVVGVNDDKYDGDKHHVI